MRWPAVLILTAFVAPGSGFAQDAENSDYEEEFDFLVEGEKNAARIAATKGASADDFSAYDEEEEFADFELRPKAPKVAPRLPYSLAGKAPLGDNYEATVVFAERDAVVIELPVLVARSPADFSGGDFWLVGEALQGGVVVAASRSWVSADSLAQAGPTLAFVKMLVPVSSTAGDLVIRMSRLADGQATPTVLFSRSVSYQLRQ